MNEIAGPNLSIVRGSFASSDPGTSASEKTTVWPFRKSADGSVLFSPMGLSGTQYFVPDAATQARLAHRVGLGFQIQMLTISLLRLGGAVLDANGLSRQQRVIVDTATVYLIAPAFFALVWFVFRQARGLPVAVSRPPLRQACRLLANSLRPVYIYVIQAVAIGFAALGFFELECRTLVNRTIGIVSGTTIFVIAIGIALFCCFLLCIRDNTEVINSKDVSAG